MKQVAKKLTARIGWFVLVFFLVASIVSGTPTLQSYMFTKSVPQPCNVPTPITSALPTDKSVFLWFYLTGLNVGDIAASRWVDPLGNEYMAPNLGGEWTPATGPNICFYEELIIAGQPPATRPGNWTVTGYLNSSPIFTLKLAISQTATSTISVNITQVISTGCPVTKLLTSVTNNGSLISGLSASNFTLKEDGLVRPVTVTTVSSGTTGALSVALLIDASGSVSGTPFTDEKAAAKSLVNLLGSTDAAAIFGFDTTVVLKQDYTSNKIALSQAIDALGGGGDTNLYGAIIQAAQSLASRTGRKAIILMTDGHDTVGSSTIDQAIAAAKNAGAPVFTVGFGSEAAQYASILSRIATETGGQTFQSATSTGLQSIFQAIGQTITNLYEVSYTTADATKDHTVELTVSYSSPVGGSVTGTTTKSVSKCQTASSGWTATINQVITTTCPANQLVLTVADSQGRPVTGLTASNFTVKEDGQVRSVTLSSGGSSAGALTLAIVIDRSGSLSSTDLANEKQAAKNLVAQLSPSDLVTVWVFDTDVQKLLDPTTNRTAINSAIDSIQGGNSTALYKALVQAADLLAKYSGRKGIVVMTDGGDNNSGSLTQADAISHANLASAPIFPIGFGQADEAVLTAIAKGTGGFYSKSASSADLLNILQLIGQVLSNQYILSYTSASGSAAHTLEVTVQGGTSSAVVTRSVSACSVSTSGVKLTVGSASGSPGSNAEIPITISSTGATPAAFQIDVTWDGSKLSYNSARAGDQLTTSSKQLSATALGTTGVRLVGAGLNQNPIADGTVAYVSLKLAPGFAGTTPVGCANAQASDAQGKSITTTCVAGQMKSAARCGCDVNGDGTINVQDVQVIINQVLGLVAAVCDLNGDGTVNIGDVQVVINAILGQSCPIT